MRRALTSVLKTSCDVLIQLTLNTTFILKFSNISQTSHVIALFSCKAQETILPCRKTSRHPRENICTLLDSTRVSYAVYQS